MSAASVHVTQVSHAVHVTEDRTHVTVTAPGPVGGGYESAAAQAATEAARDAAAASEAAALASEQAAAASEAVATTKAGEAVVSAAAASASAIAAAASETAAGASETAAAASESAAASSESAAAASASAASGSASAAASSASSAASSFDSFDDRYLGAKASAPTVDNDGAALLTGALYWDTALGALRVWDGAAWTNTTELDDRVLADQQLLGAVTYVTDMALQGIRNQASLEDTVNTALEGLASYDPSIEQIAYALTHLADLAGVIGRAISGGDVILRAGTAAEPSLSPASDRNTGVLFPAADTVAISTGGSERVRVDSNGRLGIGTTAPSGLLDVADDKLRVRTAKTPATAGATGNAGEICWNSSYIYVCTATNTWKRAALSTW